jgi:LPS-assembly protein
MYNQKRLIVFLFLALTFVYSFCGAESILKQHIQKKNEGEAQPKTVLFADEIINDDKNKIVTAKGHVEITRDCKTIYADVITYDEKTDIITAFGNVRLHDDKGNVIFSCYAELTGDLKEAFAEEIRAILSDNALLAANQSRRIEDTKNQLELAVYSPCKVCKKDPNLAPLWQIKARRAVLDEETEDVTYTDAFMEFFGVPVMYTPYLSHPSPTVNKRSGILAPIYGGSKDLGFIFGVPFFYDISPDKDITITPVYTKLNPLLIASYRQRFCHGKLRFDFSITKSELIKGLPTNEREMNEVRGHIDTEGLFDINRNWRAGFDIKRALDETYFRRYKFLGFQDDSFLTSRVYAERFTERDYAMIEAMSYQGLRVVDQQKRTPFIAPSADLNLVSGPSWFGGTFYLDGNLLNLVRERGTKMQRFSATGSWRRETIYDEGYVVDLNASLRQDVYHIEDFRRPLRPNRPLINNKEFTGTRARFFPQFTGDIKYPFIKFIENARLIIEPIVGLVAAIPHVKNREIPDEDSNLFEFNDVNLFAPIRFAGLDRIDPGSRLNWGVRTALFSSCFTNTELFLGQSYAFEENDRLQRRRGLHQHLSDYVARASFNYRDWLSLEGRFMFDRRDLSAKRNESTASIGPAVLRVSAMYSRLPRVFEPTFATEQILYKVGSNFAENWTAEVYQYRELGRKGGKLTQGASLTYTDECFTFVTRAYKDFYVDRDVRPGWTFGFALVFKNLGQIAFTTDQLGLTDPPKKGDGGL